MTAVADTDAIKTITTHYIDGAFVESHGHEVMDIIRPTDGRVIARVTLADEDDTRRAIGAARRRGRKGRATPPVSPPGTSRAPWRRARHRR